MLFILKTKNEYQRKSAERLIADMNKKLNGVLDYHAHQVDSKDESKGMIITINGYVDAQVIIGGPDGSYIHIWYMKDGVNQFFDIDLSKVTRIVQL